MEKMERARGEKWVDGSVYMDNQEEATVLEKSTRTELAWKTRNQVKRWVWIGNGPSSGCFGR